MEIFGPLLLSTIAGLSTMLGSLIIFFKIKRVEEFITFCLSFSLSVMIMISVLDLIPSSSFNIINTLGLLKGVILCIIFFVLGMALVNITNKKINNCILNVNSKSLYKVGLLSMIALILHNLPEGMATFMSAYKDMRLGINLSIAIMMHNIPEGISIAVPLFYSTGSRGKSILYTFVSGIAEPLGAILTFIFFKNYISELTISMILLLVGGIMITLAINELLPEAIKYNKKHYLNVGLLLGVVVVLINHFII